MKNAKERTEVILIIRKYEELLIGKHRKIVNVV